MGGILAWLERSTRWTNSPFRTGSITSALADMLVLLMNGWDRITPGGLRRPFAAQNEGVYRLQADRPPTRRVDPPFRLLPRNPHDG